MIDTIIKTRRFETEDECESFIKTYLAVVNYTAVVVAFFINLALTNVLYHGMRERIYLSQQEEERLLKFKRQNTGTVSGQQKLLKENIVPSPAHKIQ